MTLHQWLLLKKIKSDNVLALSISSDGFKVGRDHVMAISVTGNFDQSDISTIYIEGADPSKVKDITEVSEARYHENAMSWEEATDILRPIVEQADIIVIFHKKYVNTWIQESFSDLFFKKTIFDLSPLIKCQDMAMPLPMDVDTLDDLNYRLEAATTLKRGGYSLDAVCARLTPGYDGDTIDAPLTGGSPKLERQVYRIHCLWNVAKNREC